MNTSATNLLTTVFTKDTQFLITGGAGFIGANLVEAFLSKGYKVRVLDNFSTGCQSNLAEFIGNPNLEIIEGDIRDPEVCIQACTGVDHVLHNAALAHILGSINSPLLYQNVNITGFLNMLEAARVCKVKRFVYASSSGVYGDSVIIPKTEGFHGTPQSPYGLTRLTAEHYGELYTKLYGLATYGLRYFNVYGPKQATQGASAGVVAIFTKALMGGNAPEIYGDGTQTRDFVYVDDVVDANIKACLADEKYAGESFNVGTGTGVELLQLYRTICSILQVDIRPKYAPVRTGDIKFNFADVEKAKYMLEHEYQYELNQGLEKYIAWCKKQ